MKIDFVITWVDGSDPKWIEEKNKYFPEQKDDAQRFRDWNLLKYWFRGVEEFAPWVNKIHFVTWGHVPKFLNVDHPKINIVKHEDFIPSQYLPTFNSNTIDLNLFRIKDLSEKFVYFNDDTFIIKNTTPEDFFRKGLPSDVAILNPIVAKNKDSIANVMLNNMGIINGHFSLRKKIKENPWKWFNFKYKQLNLLNFLFLPWKSTVGLYQQHLASSFQKEKIQEIWEMEINDLHETSLRKQRNNKLDINQWLIKKWQVMEGDFSPRDINFGKYLMVRTLEDVETFDKFLKKRNTKLICVNDDVETGLEEIITSLQHSFDKILPNKSSYEI